MRYVIRPKLISDDFEDSWYVPETVTVYDDGPVDTGLVDRHGNPIWRENDPIGF